MKRLFPIALVLLFAAILTPAKAYNDGFGEHGPDWRCYQAWCYMGRKANHVGSSVEPDNYQGGIGMVMEVHEWRIEFNGAEECPYSGKHHIRLDVTRNLGGGRLATKTVYSGMASSKQGLWTIPNQPDITEAFNRGRFAKVYIYRNGGMCTSATYPLYGFARASSHIR
ncbi:MAG: hypothetical protein C0605_08360 [Hyphomicrobiales bacterium]|nr:MAG: hypothetical protein C0605_08360 [Hyphomicrobiales bacterium]